MYRSPLSHIFLIITRRVTSFGLMYIYILLIYDANQAKKNGEKMLMLI
jgi:hypothetical protein